MFEREALVQNRLTASTYFEGSTLFSSEVLNSNFIRLYNPLLLLVFQVPSFLYLVCVRIVFYLIFFCFQILLFFLVLYLHDDW